MKSTRLSVTLETPLFDRVLIRKKEMKGSRGEILKPKAAMAGDTFIALCQSHTLASPAKNLRPQDSNAWFRSSNVKRSLTATLPDQATGSF